MIPLLQNDSYPSEEGDIEERRIVVDELECKQFDDQSIVVSRLCPMILWNNTSISSNPLLLKTMYTKVMRNYEIRHLFSCISFLVMCMRVWFRIPLLPVTIFAIMIY